MLKIMFPVLIIMISVGCSSTSLKVRSALEPARDIGTEVICEKDQCQEYWQRAQVWIAKHSYWKIQTATDVTIVTYNPTRRDASYGFTVIKEPGVFDMQIITIRMNCGNMFGCSPKPEDVQRAFLYYVKTGIDLLIGIGYLGGAIN